MSNPHLIRVQRILEKLQAVRARGLSCFGSESHQFRLNAPLGEAELTAFEMHQGVRLPEDYRTFLLNAGNGGAGPHYGMFPLSRWRDFTDGVLDGLPDDLLARPCPLHPDMDRSESWEGQFGGVLPYQGTLTLGTHGCTFFTQLIVAGPHAGRVVYVDEDGQAPYVCHEPDFLAWYERWLDELLKGSATVWRGFGFGPAGSEEDLVRILDDPAATDRLKSEAAAALGRLPSLSEGATARVVACCRHPLAGVRAGACATIEMKALAAGMDEAIRLLNDPEAEVRRNAVRAAMRLNAGRCAEPVRRRLQEETDDDVVSTAMTFLNQAGALTREDRLSIAARSTSGQIRYHALHGVSWVEDDLGTLVRLLSDAEPHVRSCAVLGLRQLRLTAALPQVVELLQREQDPGVVDHALHMLGELGDGSVVPVLLEWTSARDDFHRLHALGAMAGIGDERAAPVAAAMLQETRKPERWHAGGGMTGAHSIGELVARALRESPCEALRELAHGMPAFATASAQDLPEEPLPYVNPDPLITGRTVCCKCAYQLRGLPRSGLCPECGTPNMESVRAERETSPAEGFGRRMDLVLRIVTIGALIVLGVIIVVVAAGAIRF